VLLFGDEAFYAGDKKHESILKTLITEESIVIERKGLDAESLPNYVHLIMASNSAWVAPAGPNERRFLVLDVLPNRMQDHAYFDQLGKELNAGGHENLLYYLQTLDLSNFNVRSVPKTIALRDQKILSMDSVQEWWFRKLEDGILLPRHIGWTHPVLKEELVLDYLTYAQRVSTGRRSTATQLGRFLAKVTPLGPKSFQAYVDRREIGGDARERAYFWEFPDLDECRRGFDKECGGPFPWPVIETKGSLNKEGEAF
jgi:hypothetical protein